MKADQVAEKALDTRVEAVDKDEAALQGGTLTDRIQQLKDLQTEMKKARKEAQKKLKNLERQKKRLSAKARLLTDEDLVQVLKLRRAKAAKGPTTSVACGSHEDPRKDA